MRLLFAMFISLFLFSCTRPQDYYVTFENRSDKTVVVDAWCNYPADSVTMIIDMMTTDSNPLEEFLPKEVGKMVYGGEKLSSWYQFFYLSETECSGYVSFYIMDADKRNNADPQEVIDSYDILARYDLRSSDLESLNWRITFPPSAEMSGVHMWLNSYIQKE